MSELETKKFIKTPNSEFVEPMNVLFPKKTVYTSLIAQSDSEFLHLDGALNKLLEFRIPSREILKIIMENKSKLNQEIIKKDDGDSRIDYLVSGESLNRNEMIEYLKFLSYLGIGLNYGTYCYQIVGNDSNFQFNKVEKQLYYTGVKELKELV